MTADLLSSVKKLAAKAGKSELEYVRLEARKAALEDVLELIEYDKALGGIGAVDVVKTIQRMIEDCDK